MPQLEPPITLNQFSDWIDFLTFNNCDPEESLDYITREAATVFKVPIAMINLVTSKYIIFKSCVGVKRGDRLDNRGNFCALATKAEEPLLIPDTALEQNLQDDPIVAGPLKIRSYFGKSLHAPDGSRIGTLCLLDIKPRNYSAIQTEVLLHFANMAEQKLHTILKPYADYERAVLAAGAH